MKMQKNCHFIHMSIPRAGYSVGLVRTEPKTLLTEPKTNRD